MYTIYEGIRYSDDKCAMFLRMSIKPLNEDGETQTCIGITPERYIPTVLGSSRCFHVYSYIVAMMNTYY